MNPLAKIWQLALIGLTLILTSNLAIAQDKDPATAWQLIEQGAMLVDVRTPEEYAAGHLEGAINIPYEVIATEFAKRAIDKDTSVVLYCRSGRRSGVANDALNAAGFTRVYNGGGYESLVQSGKSGQGDK
ncbi:rhodanese-like domain-containing protein [Shewanella litorisediminis]|uniref:Rhodanese-like domain-containing protein n=1 Tax=Shewanella litorisediminis TaxID=1173586 RepID=A0ABX7FZH4_9GAMM|nr:rhodanese-like domain-containing protein [Shewanella litorisediminis]MCL2919501.1 rhodanese-like domain-containing protein [Shewanella litorisediminis]QRH00460.1 rhodanese-like domain-containing protein [Shewanella litorisediminis]